MRKIREQNDRNEERSRQLSDKVDKNKMSDAEMAAELQRLQAGEERRGSNASQTGDCCWEALVEQRFVLGVDQARSKFCKKFEARVPSEQMPGKEEGRRNSGDGQEHGRASSWCYWRQPGSMKANKPASSLELDLLRVRVHMVKAEEQENQGHWAIATEDYQTLQVDVQWKRIHSQGAKGMRENSWVEQKQKRNSQGKDPRTFEENSQGGDLSSQRGPENLQRPGRKVASSRIAEGREVEEKEEKRLKKNKVQRKDRKIPHGREERRRGRKERQEE